MTYPSIPSIAHASQVRAAILHTSVGTDAGLTFTGTVDAAAPPANAFDWFDWTLARIQGASATFQWAAPAAGWTIDAWAWWALPTGALGGETWTLALQRETAAGSGSWVTLATVDLAATPGPGLTLFAASTLAVGVGLRVVATVPSGKSLWLRQLSIGQALRPELGQWQGIAPTALQLGAKSLTQPAINGSLLSLDVLRVERSANLDFSPCSRAWVDGQWMPFLRAAQTHAFWYSWAPDDHPTDVVLAMASGALPAPTNETPIGFLKVSLNLTVVGGGNP